MTYSSQVYLFSLKIDPKTALKLMRYNAECEGGDYRKRKPQRFSNIDGDQNHKERMVNTHYWAYEKMTSPIYIYISMHV